MKLHILIMLVLVFNFTALAQTTEKKVVRWLSPELPKDCCSNYTRNNLLYTTYTSPDLEYLVILHTSLIKDHIAISIGFKNHSETPITIEPSKFKIRMTEPVNKDYLPIPVEDVAKKFKNDGKWRSVFGSIMAGMATRQTTGTINDNRGNRADVTITERDNQAIANAREANQARQARNNEGASIIREISLPSHTLFKDEIISGFVYFKKDKIGDGLILSFEIGNTIYEVPFGKERTGLNK